LDPLILADARNAKNDETGWIGWTVMIVEKFGLVFGVVGVVSGTS